MPSSPAQLTTWRSAVAKQHDRHNCDHHGNGGRDAGHRVAEAWQPLTPTRGLRER